MLTCLPMPLMPVDPVTDRDVARWILALRSAGDDCRGKLVQVEKLLRESAASGG